MSRTRRTHPVERVPPKPKYGTRQPIINRIVDKAKRLGMGVEKAAQSYIDQVMAAVLPTDLDKIGKKIKLDADVATVKKDFTELIEKQKQVLQTEAEIQKIKNDPIGYYTRQHEEIIKRIQIAQTKLDDIIKKRAEKIEDLTGIDKDTVLELNPMDGSITDEKDTATEAKLIAGDADTLDKWVGTMKQFIEEEQEKEKRSQKRITLLQDFIARWGQERGVEKFLVQGDMK